MTLDGYTHIRGENMEGIAEIVEKLMVVKQVVKWPIERSRPEKKKTPQLLAASCLLSGGGSRDRTGDLLNAI